MDNEIFEIDKSFQTDYLCKIISEVPTGEYKRYYYPEGKEEGGVDGILLRVSQEQGDEWIGVFSSSQKYPKSLSKIFSWPDSHKICVVSSGEGVIVDVNNPLNFEIINIEPIFHAIPIQERRIVVFAGFTNLVAYGQDGIYWKTQRISWDGLEITGVDQSFINGTYWDIKSESKKSFKVSIANGDVKGGIEDSI